MHGKLLVLLVPTMAMASFVGGCSTDDEENKPRDAYVEPDTRLKDAGTKEQRLPSCEKACGGGVLCFMSVSLCEGTCSAFVVSAQKQSEACANCVIGLFEDGVCPETYTEALIACDDCELECKDGEDACGDRCVDLKTDNYHCGKCDEVCNQEEFFFCTDGKCACDTGLTDCSGVCTNLRMDTKNCGTCGKACAPGDSCLNSACCLAPKKVCNNACIDVLANNANCGFCGKVCDAGTTCQAGSCLP